MENQSLGNGSPLDQASLGEKFENLFARIIMRDSRAWKGMVWHHSASPDGVARDWPGIAHYHTSYRIDFNIVSKEDYDRRLAAKEGAHFEVPWRAVGYNGGVELVAGIPVFWPGRPLSMIGAHAGLAGHSNAFNEEYIGLCCIGNYDVFPPSKPVWDFCLGITRAFMARFNFPAAHVLGHRETFDKLGVPRQKTCPGAAWSMDMFRQDLG